MSLKDDICKINPEILNGKIKAWDTHAFDMIKPFVTEYYWHNAASINIFRVVGTQHPDYIGLSWLEFLEKGKRMSLNLREYEINPQYYDEHTKKEPTMYYLSIDGGDLFVGDDGNHRTCIAKASFFLEGKSLLHGVTVRDYRVDWTLKKLYNEILQCIEKRNLHYRIEPWSKTLSRDDSGGWMLEKYNPKIKVVDKNNGREFYLDNTAGKEFLEDIRRKKKIWQNIFAIIKTRKEKNHV